MTFWGDLASATNSYVLTPTVDLLNFVQRQVLDRVSPPPPPPAPQFIQQIPCSTQIWRTIFARTTILRLPSQTFLVRLAGVSGALAVGLGAYGAHTLLSKESDLSVQRKSAFETASRYHFFHTFLLALSPMAPYPLVTGALVTAGMSIFCGTCYIYGIQGTEEVRKYTPTGGILLIVAWLSLVL